MNHMTKFKWLWVALCVIVIIAIATSCGKPAPTSGYVRDKDFRPAFTDRWDTQDCAYSDGKGVCYIYETHHHSEFHPDRWRFYLENCDEVKDGKQKCHRGWRIVDQTTYYKFDINKHFPDSR